ncbi:hypothetical protein [Saccharopolyspora kobensis]|uniref:hypothetical protein n=1 Tax=Saccharopolyspora kobensis TaxID=146035 RepID=UPI000B8638B4|nr:hypothetical protein [Saccharopolyspora kobensis]
MFPGETWRLHRGEELVGEIEVTDADFPWLSGPFRPQPAFAEFEPVFAAELELAESDDDWAAWEQIYDRINEALTLVSPRGPVAEFILHVQDGEAWFRWIDEPPPR